MLCIYIQSSHYQTLLIAKRTRRWSSSFRFLLFMTLGLISPLQDTSFSNLHAQRTQPTSTIKKTEIVRNQGLSSPKKSSSETTLKRKQEIKRWSLNKIENHLLRFRLTHWIQSFEIGQINWTLRTIHTLGVGTHQILSPTGGWSKSDLLTKAHQKIQSSFTRLTQLFYPSTMRPTCDWQTYSKRFQSKDPLFFSDGSVHVNAWISFDMYQTCWTKGPQNWTELLNKIHQGKRNIVVIWIYDPQLNQSQKTALSPSLDLSSIISSWSQKEKSVWLHNWRTIRWLMTSSSSTLDPLMASIHPSFTLKSAVKSLSSNQTKLSFLQDHLSSDEQSQLNRLKKEQGGTELWMIVHGDQL